MGVVLRNSTGAHPDSYAYLTYKLLEVVIRMCGVRWLMKPTLSLPSESREAVQVLGPSLPAVMGWMWVYKFKLNSVQQRCQVLRSGRWNCTPLKGTGV